MSNEKPVTDESTPWSDEQVEADERRTEQAENLNDVYEEEHIPEERDELYILHGVVAPKSIRSNNRWVNGLLRTVVNMDTLRPNRDGSVRQKEKTIALTMMCESGSHADDVECDWEDLEGTPVEVVYRKRYDEWVDKTTGEPRSRTKADVVSLRGIGGISRVEEASVLGSAMFM